MDEDYEQNGYDEEDYTFTKTNNVSEFTRTRDEEEEETKQVEEKPRRGRKKKEEDVEEVVLRVKEFDINQMPPQAASDYSGTKCIIVGKPGCHPQYTKVIMSDCSIRNIETIEQGEQVMGDDGTPRTVLQLCRGYEEMFEIQPIKGEPYTVNLKHKLVLVASGGVPKYPKGMIDMPTVEEYLAKPGPYKKTFKIFKASCIETWKEQQVPVDPHFLGIWLGDGTSANTSITTIDQEIIDYCTTYAQSLGLVFNKLKAKYRYSAVKDVDSKENIILEGLKSLGVINNKHIPLIYKHNSKANRLALLAGIIDTDGHYDKKGKGYEISQKNDQLADDIVFIARSLGFCATTRKVNKYCMYRGEKREGVYNKIYISGVGLEQIPCLLPRKKFTDVRKMIKNPLVSGFKVVPKGPDNYYGFTLDGNNLYLLKSFDVVRNTGKSTLVQSLIAAKSHICPVIQVYNGTEESSQYYSRACPNILVHDRLDIDSLVNFSKRQRLAIQYLENAWAMLIIDDCTDDPKQLRHPLMQNLFKNGRHLRMIFILVLQYCMDILPSIRTSVDYTFILRESSKKNRKKLYENYCPDVVSEQEFYAIMDECTENFSAVVICNRTVSNKIEDCIFYYKADPASIPSNLRLGHQTCWQFNEERFDPHYTPNIMGSLAPGAKKKSTI